MTLKLAVIAPVSTNRYNDKILAAIKPVVPDDVTVEAFNLSPEEAHRCIENRVDLIHNAYAVVKTALRIQEKGYDGIWLSDFDMCGVEACREVLDIPIIGGFPPSAFTALSLSQRFSIITILPSTVSMQREHIHTYSLQSGFASIRDINEHIVTSSAKLRSGGAPCPDNVLEWDEADIGDMVFEQAKAAVLEDGAQSILLGCTGFIDVARSVSERLTAELGAYVPVIDPNQAGFSFLVSLVRMSLRPSRLCYWKDDTKRDAALHLG